MADETVRQYESALTGPEMDQALLDMANHTSERYAKGTVNGVPVTSGEVGFQDNSEYFKDQAAASAATAENAATRAESAVPPGTESAVLWTTGQSINESGKSQARVNIGANVTVVTSTSFSSLPQTITNANIKADHVVLNSVLSNPSAQISNWTVTTSNGSLTIAGSISGTTNITLYLYPQA